MKKLLFILAIMFAGQASFAQLFTFGPRVGVTSSQISIEDNVANLESGDRAFGFQAGIFARVKLGPVYVQPEVLFTNAGGDLVSIDGNGAEQITEYDFNKLDIPVLLGYKTGPFRINAGPVASLMLNAESTESLTNLTTDLTDNYNNATIGFQAGVGLDLWKFIVDLKYEGSLGSITDDFSIGGQTFATDQRQNQIILALGFKII